MLTYEKLGEKLKEARKLSGLTQEQAAVECAISRSKLIEIEKGNGPIDTVLLDTMANAYGFSISYFLEDDPNTEEAEFEFAFRANELEVEDQETVNWARKVLFSIRDIDEIFKEID